MKRKNKIAITVSLVVILAILLVYSNKPQSITQFKDVPGLGKVKVTLQEPTLLSRFLTITWLDTTVYQGESAELRDVWTLSNGACSIDYWKIKIERSSPYHNYGEMDVTDIANQLSLNPCKYDVYMSFNSDEVGDYTAGGRFKQTGSTEITIPSTNVLHIISNPNILTCEWQPWEFFYEITGGYVEWREYKDLNLNDGISCNLPNQYKTYCDSGYHIGGTTSDNVADGIKTCVLDSGGGQCSGPYGSKPNGCSCRIDSDCVSQNCDFFMCVQAGGIDAVCGDGVCQYTETFASCPQDCGGGGGGTCSDGIHNQNEEGVDCGGACPKCEVPPFDYKILLIVVGVGIILYSLFMGGGKKHGRK